MDQPSLVPLDADGHETMTVTPVDANHCAGACMFVMQGYFGTVLATGDFRFAPPILDALPTRTFDRVFIDNTYCHPSCIFPSREDARADILRIINRFPGHDVFIGIDTLGKEPLLVYLAQHLQMRIHVSEPQLAFFQQLELDDVFTLDPAETRIHAISKAHLSAARINAERQHGPVLGILPTALVLGATRRNWPLSDSELYDLVIDGDIPIISVPYSNHSNYNELRVFVSKLSMAQITPMLRNDPERDIHRYMGDLLPPLHIVQAAVTIPPTVQSYMSRSAGNRMRLALNRPPGANNNLVALSRPASKPAQIVFGDDSLSDSESPQKRQCARPCTADMSQMPDAQLSLSADYQSQLMPSFSESGDKGQAPRATPAPTTTVTPAAVQINVPAAAAAVPQPKLADEECAAQIRAFNQWLEQWQAGIRTVLTPPAAPTTSDAPDSAVLQYGEQQSQCAQPQHDTVGKSQPAQPQCPSEAAPAALPRCSPPKPRSPRILQQLNAVRPAYPADKRKQALVFRQFALSRK